MTVLITKTTKQQSTNVRQQRRRTTTAGKRQGAVVEAEEGCGMCIFLNGGFQGGRNHTSIIIIRIPQNNAHNRGKFS
jgi:hypothetical protein